MMIASDWLAAPEGLRADLVLSADALYRTADVGAALEKMTRAAKGKVALVQTVGRPHAGPLKLVEGDRVWERERADALVDVAQALGFGCQRRDYDVRRPNGDSRVCLIVWPDTADRGP